MVPTMPNESLTLEIVEGPGAGRQIRVASAFVMGRDASADVVIEDDRASRRHARILPDAGGVIVEDLGSSNGTFVNHLEVHGQARLDPGDELLIGVTVMQLRSAGQVAAQPSVVRTIPPGLAAAERRPNFVDAVSTSKDAAAGSGVPELDRLVDARTKHKARLAPIAVLALVVLVVLVFLATR